MNFEKGWKETKSCLGGFVLKFECVLMLKHFLVASARTCLGAAASVVSSTVDLLCVVWVQVKGCLDAVAHACNTLLDLISFTANVPCGLV